MKCPSEHRRGDFFLHLVIFSFKNSAFLWVLPPQPDARGWEVGNLKVAFRGPQRTHLSRK